MKPVYAGIFFDQRSYNELKMLASTLGKSIDYPHVTLEYKPDQLLPNDIVGAEVVVTIVGNNQGFEVTLPRDLRGFYKNPSKPHVTVSLDPVAGKAVNTGKLNFRPIQQKTIVGRIGYFTGKGVKFDNNF